MHYNVKDDDDDQECKLPVQAAPVSNHEGDSRIQREHQAAYPSVRYKTHIIPTLTAQSEGPSPKK